MVKIVAMVRERLVTTEVDGNELAGHLKTSARVAAFRGFRAGEPAELTQTESDPISHKRLATLHLVLESLKKRPNS